MKASELRIGNMVSLYKGVNDNGADWKTYEISNGFDIYKLDENDCGDIKPIPLTEDWLLKLGFNTKTYNETDGSLNFWSKEMDASIDIELISDKETHFFYKQNDKNLCQLFYVHELQNLYFCLKRKELELK